MAAVFTRDIIKKFDEVPAVDGITPHGAGRRVHGACWGRRAAARRRSCGSSAGSRSRPSGDIMIGGDVVNDIPPRARGVAMMFQSYGLYPHYTVRKNIAFPLRTQRVPRRPDRKEGRVGVATARHRASPRSPAAPALRRRASARRARARAGARADGVPARRAALESRRQTARLGPPGDQAIPAAGRRSPPST